MAKPKTLLCIGARQVRSDVARAAEEHVEMAGIFATPEALVDRLDGSVALVVVDIASLSVLARHYRRGIDQELGHRPAVILTIADHELRDALGLIHLCNGILYWQHDLDKLGRLIVITLEGYCGVPPDRLPDLISDRLRIGLLDRLLPLERETLRLLSQALTNRAIAHRLGVAEPVAKSLVRSVLMKLRLKNRTEAAVFAVRWHGSDAPDVSPRPNTFPEAPEWVAS